MKVQTNQSMELRRKRTNQIRSYDQRTDAQFCKQCRGAHSRDEMLALVFREAALRDVEYGEGLYDIAEERDGFWRRQTDALDS